MKKPNQARRAMLATMLAGTTLVTATGCSGSGMSLASMNPFAKSAPAQPGLPPGSSMSESFASAAEGAKSRVSSLGQSAKGAMSKTTGAIAGVFGRDQDAAGANSQTPDDPLRLDNKPEKVSADVFVANGQLWESTGNFVKAMESYTQALESEPNNAPALTSIARLHFRQGNHPQAAEFFQQAIAQTPDDAGLHNDLGLTLSKLGRHELAAQALTRALELAPGTSRYANNLASIKYEAGDAKSAFQVLAENNKPAVAHFNMAYLHYKQGQMNDARGHLTESVKFEPQAAADPTIKRAVDRSREMLAQIDGPMSTIAQAGPQATIAARPTANATKTQSPVRQTGQATAAQKPAVVPAAGAATVPPAAAKPSPLGSSTSPGSSTSSLPQQLGASPPARITPAAGLPSYASPQPYQAPSYQPPAYGVPSYGTANNSATGPAAAAAPAGSTAPASSTATPTPQASGSGFSLPPSFQMPNPGQ